MPSYPLLIHGNEVTTDRILEVRNPYDQSIVGTTYLAGPDELEQAIRSAGFARQILWKTPAWKRSEILTRISSEIKYRREELARLLSNESAKPLKYALGEIDRAAQSFKVASEETKRLPSEHLQIDWTPSGEGREGIVKYFPLGLVAGISPFNFPMNLAVHKIAPAIAAGCPIILKPASSTPLSSLELAKIIQGTDLPKGSVTILPMDRATGNQLVTDPRFALLTFTGSPAVGWKMKSQAGKKKVVLELGGNAGVIISEGTDLVKAMPRLVLGAFAYSGQVCIHAQRFFVHNSLIEEFKERMIEAANTLKWGPPADLETDISAMIDEKNTARMDLWVEEAKASGAKVLAGGYAREGVYAPTILSDVKKEMKVCAEEVFGPIITLEGFDRFEEAINRLNDTRFGLQAGVYTNKISEMDMAFERIECGGVIINDVPTFRVDHMPYGGIKESGLGREGIKYAIHDMMEPRILVKPKA